ncbi:MAG: Jag N-terminal domain-containing protein [Firmicutes bacterium]|nr:Jag N-terminal domain-containing protein [Bacillota bacterium]MDY6160324.1 RNA-binding cell elongation regulator Jag/EloR [Candidatus Faecousia sp.]
MEMKHIITGKTIEEAKANAVAQLGLDADGFSYQVIQLPKSGFLGFGAQPAKIEVSYEVPDPQPEAPKVALSAASRSKPKPAKKPEPQKQEPVKAEMPKAEPVKQEAPAAPKAETPEVPKPEKKERREPRKPQPPKEPKETKEPKEPKVYAVAEPGSVEERIEVFLKGLLEHMGSQAVPHCWKEEGNTYQVELVGEDLGYLIGRRGDTLDAIQHLANYSINRDVEGHIRINVDAESYREKREESLRRYAVKKAQQVLKMRRRTTLEPMNAYERHVIHAALQDMDNITTHSTGVEPNRCVVIEYLR